MGHLDHVVRDEEDIAVSAMKSFWLAVRKKEDKLSGRDELWQLLVTITKRKIIREAEKQNAQKRDVKKAVREASHFQRQAGNDEFPQTFDAVLPGCEPTPELILEGLETLDRIVALPDVGKIAKMKFQGHTNTEIAIEFGCSTRTIERKIEKIMKIWQEWEENVGRRWDDRDDKT